VSVHRRVTLVCTAFLVASVLFGSDGDPRSEALGATTITTEGGARRPILAPQLSERVAARFNDALSVALGRLRTYPSCRALFARLGADGVAELKGASYYPASDEQERKYCRREVYALTKVGGSAVVLCRRFGHLSGPRAAIILIHEALHLAGQTEEPADPEAPDSFAITRKVMRGCWLF
jgi:hypothetical protein